MNINLLFYLQYIIMNYQAIFLNTFLTLLPNQCYFFNYGTVNIEQLSILLKRKPEFILYQNCVLRNFVRIFCNNKDNTSVASIYNHDRSSVYGYVVKISYDELDILESYHKNYTLKKIRVNYTTGNIYSTKIVNERFLEESNDDIFLPYVFIYDDYINNDKVLPSEMYISEIRKMLNDRKKIENVSFQKIMILCVTNIFTNTDKYYYDNDLKNIEYDDVTNDEFNEKIVILDYENI